MQSRPDPVDKVDGFFFSQDRVLRLSPVRIAYVLTFVILFVLTEFGRKVYRPFIYANSINDFGFADVVGNLLGTSVSIFFNLSFSHATRKQGYRIIVLTTIGITVYELLQPVLPRGVLDWKDVISTPISGLLSVLIFVVIRRFVRDLPAQGQDAAQEVL